MREIMLILHFIGLAMGVGVGFAFMFLGIASSKMEQNEARKFMIKSFALVRMGHIGLTLLIVSGIYLLVPQLASLPDQPLLIVKLIFVVILIALIGVNTMNMKKTNETNAGAQLKKISGLGRFSLLSGLIIIILAVLNFQ